LFNRIGEWSLKSKRGLDLTSEQAPESIHAYFKVRNLVKEIGNSRAAKNTLQTVLEFLALNCIHPLPSLLFPLFLFASLPTEQVNTGHTDTYLWVEPFVWFVRSNHAHTYVPTENWKSSNLTGLELKSGL
jgi:hypothetical protein